MYKIQYIVLSFDFVGVREKERYSLETFIIYQEKKKTIRKSRQRKAKDTIVENSTNGDSDGRWHQQQQRNG